MTFALPINFSEFSVERNDPMLPSDGVLRPSLGTDTILQNHEGHDSLPLSLQEWFPLCSSSAMGIQWIRGSLGTTSSSGLSSPASSKLLFILMFQPPPWDHSCLSGVHGRKFFLGGFSVQNHHLWHHLWHREDGPTRSSSLAPWANAPGSR